MRRAILVIIFFALNTPAYSDDRQKIVIIEVVGFSELDGNGAYSKILRKILQDKSIQVELYAVPEARALHDYKRGEATCIFPTNKTFNDLPGIQGSVVNFFSVHIFVLLRFHTS